MPKTRVSSTALAALLSVCLLGMSPMAGGADEGPYLLADIAKGPVDPAAVSLSEEPSGFFQLGDRLLFSTADPDSLDQAILWSTDDTARGTVQLSTSLCVSTCVSITPLATWRGVVLLRIVSGPDLADLKTFLGRTDGTAAGTFLLSEDFDNEDFWTPLDVYVLRDDGGFYLSGCSGGDECRLWRSDGTRAGTAAVQGPDSLPFLFPHSFTLWGDRLYFVAAHGDAGAEGLWSVDGAGTLLFLHAIEDTDTFPAQLAATPSRLFFTADRAGEALWATDGSPAGTQLVAGFAPSSCTNDCGTTDVDSMTVAGGEVYFFAHRAGHSIEIWRSDGTAAGTIPLIELPARVAFAQGLRRIGGQWIFVAALPDREEVLWTVDDGFTDAARLTGCGGGACPAVLGPLPDPTEGLWLFMGYDTLHGFELWATDGTAPGTRLLADACPGNCQGFPGIPEAPTLFPGPSGKVYFQAHPDLQEGAYGIETDELWVTDGTPSGTQRVAGQAAGVGFLNGRVYFGGSQPDHPGSELWSTDGVPGHERRIAVLRRFELGSSPQFRPFRDGVLLTAVDGEGRLGLWTSDGTPRGTFPVAAFPADSLWDLDRFLGLARGAELFTLFRHFETRPLDRPEVWRTDGTPGGTRALAALPLGGFTDGALAWDGKVLFTVFSSSGCSLWSSDGTAAGTREILPTGSHVACPQLLGAFGPRFLFVAEDDRGQRPQLFVSDGTAAGTHGIALLAEGSFYASQPVRIGGTVFFPLLSADASVPAQAWRTDGTPEGTRPAFPLTDASDLHAFGDSLVAIGALGDDPAAGRGLFRIPLGGGAPVLLARIFDFSASSLFPPVQFAQVGDRLLFTVQDLDRGFELWGTDGTAEGTVRLRQFQRSPLGFSEAETLAPAGDRVFFAASDGVHGRELWESDGTRAGTRRVTDLAPGGFSALPAPSSFGVANGFLFFAADDGKTGLEPWALRLEP
jgi:ELWxxDGT repeat protein